MGVEQSAGDSLSVETDDDGENDIVQKLQRFAEEEAKRLGVETERVEHWAEPLHTQFTAKQRPTTTVMVGGLTNIQDGLIGAAWQGIGYKVEPLECPNTEALRLGKEFGNRGQCNPTYFTVGNLLKRLKELEASGLTKQEINDQYLFITAGSCGPCRFGMYVTEYRKALRDSGFDGFRVMLFQMEGGLEQATGDDPGLNMNTPFFIALLKALFAGDVLNAIGYRIRPYEVEEGATDAALEVAEQILRDALLHRTNIVVAMWKARRQLTRVKVDRTRVRPSVAMIGEFWAMTTEGDGNYQMQRFLEKEGAEVDIQLVTGWLIHMLWENIRDARHRRTLRKDDGGYNGLAGINVAKQLFLLNTADVLIRVIFQGAAKLLGLHGYTLPDMFENAEAAKAFYNHDLRGGKGHAEVGKLILNAKKNTTNMTMSIKPFGCMPSSAVSDGVQSSITELYPSAIFLPVETTGDGAVNVYSRVQMMLFKARKAAQREVDTALERYGMTMEEVKAVLERVPFLAHPLLQPRRVHACSTANTVELVGALCHPIRALGHVWRKHIKPIFSKARPDGPRPERQNST